MGRRERVDGGRRRKKGAGSRAWGKGRRVGMGRKQKEGGDGDRTAMGATRIEAREGRAHYLSGSSGVAIQITSECCPHTFLHTRLGGKNMHPPPLPLPTLNQARYHSTPSTPTIVEVEHGIPWGGRHSDCLLVRGARVVKVVQP